MITSYDITAVVFYFLFMVGIAFAFKKQITDTSEYFRGGGKMLWWMCGASAFMSTFSAWTFSGAAGKAYVDGFPVIIIFLFNVVAYFICALFFAQRFRQLRVITPNQAIRQRFGKTSEQVFTWFKVISAWNTAALSLIAVSVFMSAVLGLEQQTTIILTGVVIIFMAVVGGSWAVIASDFVQCLLVLAVSFVTFLYAYNAGGGVTEIVNNFPGESFVQGSGINNTEIFLLWIAAICLQRVIGVNSLSQSVRFLSAKDSNHARKAAILAGVLFAFGSIMWFLPPIFASSAYPELGDLYPTLKRPTDGAYLVVVQNLLPAGMVGLVVAAMFAATMSALDSQINICTATIIKNFYLPIINPNADEEKQLKLSRVATVVFGVGVILLALFFQQMKGISLFQLMISVMALVSMPVFIPQLFGLFVRRVPDWAAWATLAFGAGVSLLSTTLITPEWFSNILGMEWSSRETRDLNIVIPQVAHAVLTIGFFFATGLFYKEPVGERKKEVDAFFTNVKTPVVSEEGTTREDNLQRNHLGIMSMVFGAGVLLLGAMPDIEAKAFLITGGFMVFVGGLLYYSSKVTQVSAQAIEG